MVRSASDRVIVFAGPSLPGGRADVALAADFRPPARRGDIYRVLRERPRAVVLIDGEFHGSPAVWHRELLDAMAEGVPIIGASSMGALRAAELHGLGMIGCGRIFEAFRDGVLNDDDEVALEYGPAELGYLALSEPLVNIRATLARAVAHGVIDAGQESEALGHAKSLHYARRSHAAVLSAPPFAGDAALRSRYAAFVSAHAIDQKRADAFAALRLVASASDDALTPAGLLCNRHRYSPNEGLWTVARAAMELDTTSSRLPSAAELLARAGLDPSATQTWWRELSWRWFARQWLATAAADMPADPLSADEQEPPPDSFLTPVAYAALVHEVEQARQAISAACAQIEPGGPQMRIERLRVRRSAMRGPGEADDLPEPRAAFARSWIVADWARAQGLAPPVHQQAVFLRRVEGELARSRAEMLLELDLPEPVYLAALTERARADWVVDCGPSFFGYRSWCFEAALLRELQRLGLAGPIFAPSGER